LIAGASSIAKATTCEEFVARFIEGAARYSAPKPRFELEHVNPTDPENRFFKITTFSDVRSMLSCWHGEVNAYLVDANSAEGLTTEHVTALTAVGIYGSGWTWREASALRDQIVQQAKNAKPQMAELVVEDAKLSFVISFAGFASFEVSAP
jgi:hypothetical protein